MKLRDHPLMIRKGGYANWPPLWTAVRSEDDDKPTGEVGTLEDVDMHTLIDNKIFLFMRYRGYRYMGAMVFDDRIFCRQLFEVLKLQMGRSIEEIGELNLSHTL